MTDKRDALEQTQKLFDFLQGTVPDGYQIAGEGMPHLTADQAWTVIWFLGNLYWQVTDYIERCDVCGCLFNSNSGGSSLDYGKPPYDFCDDCIHTKEYEAKKRQGSEAEEYRKENEAAQAAREE